MRNVRSTEKDVLRLAKRDAFEDQSEESNGGGGRWKREASAGADGVTPSDSRVLAEISLSGAIKPMKKIGSSTVHAPALSFCDARRRPAEREP